MVRIDRSGAKEFLPEGSLVQQAQSAIDMLKNGTGAGSDFIGWVDLPVNYDKEEFSRIQKAAKKIQSDSKALVVIGIGGSYLEGNSGYLFRGQRHFLRRAVGDHHDDRKPRFLRERHLQVRHDDRARDCVPHF